MGLYHQFQASPTVIATPYEYWGLICVDRLHIWTTFQEYGLVFDGFAPLAIPHE